MNEIECNDDGTLEGKAAPSFNDQGMTKFQMSGRDIQNPFTSILKVAQKKQSTTKRKL